MKAKTATKTTKPISLGFNMVEMPTLEEKKMSGRDWFSYGADNLFPDYLWNLYLKSSVLQSITNAITDYVLGDGIQSEIGIINKDGETAEDIIKKAATDYLIFGGFAFEVLRNSGGNIAGLYALDFKSVRTNEERDTFYFKDNWKSNKEPVVMPAFDPDKKDPDSCLYFVGHITRGVYPIPIYSGAIAAIETQTRIVTTTLIKYPITSLLPM